jgi:5-methylcytosine-specific restriction enzyme A
MNDFYKSKRWKKKREHILIRDEYLCRECQRYGKATPATTVHHVIPIEQNKSLKLNSDNLISLCDKCHNAMHDRGSNRLTELGQQWVERISPLLMKGK